MGFEKVTAYASSYTLNKTLIANDILGNQNRPKYQLRKFVDERISDKIPMKSMLQKRNLNITASQNL